MYLCMYFEGQNSEKQSGDFVVDIKSGLKLAIKSLAELKVLDLYSQVLIRPD